MSDAPMLTRRQAGLATLAAAAGPVAWSSASAQTLPAAAIADRIPQTAAPGWKPADATGLVAGDPTVSVTGVAVTAMPNMATLRKAVAQGCNMIVSLESPLYAKPYVEQPNPGPFSPAAMVKQLRADPTYAGKLAYIAQNKLALYRLDAKPQPLIQGVAETMGWQRHRDPADDRIFTLPRTTLRALAQTIKRRMGVNGGMRLIGRHDMPVRRVLVVPGRIDPGAVVKLLPQVDVLIAGDLREWELVEYFHDSWEAGQPKALIALGRILSEQPGMLAAASWLRPIVGLPVKPILVEDPYWRLPA